MMSPELEVLLACAGAVVSGAQGSKVPALLAAGMDWTGFARRALAQGLAGLAGVGLSRVAGQRVPGELVDAFAVALQGTRQSNEALWVELSVLGEALAGEVAAIALKGPSFVRAAYGDLGLRACRDLELLVREADFAPTLAVLGRLGYGCDAGSAGQRLRRGGYEVLSKAAAGAPVKVHTRLISDVPGLDLDYAGLWQRAQRSGNEAGGLLALSAEDCVLALALEGSAERWENLRRACDVAAVICSHPGLDWEALLERARAQRCLPMVLQAASLARRYFHAAVPPVALAAEHADPDLEPLAEHALAHWDRAAPNEISAHAEQRVPGPTGAAEAWCRRAEALFAVQRFAEAAAASDRALALEAEHVEAQRIGIRSRIFAYDWSQRDAEKRRITAALKAGRRVISPDNHRIICDSSEENLIAARLHSERFPQEAPLWRGERYRHERIRIAYKSTDFRQHPVGHSLAGCFEHHDKSRFETFAISLQPGDGSAVRQRIEAAFDHFIDAESLSDEQVAQMMRAREIDIVIDLNGYASFAHSGRLGILTRRPVPVQVNYFGYCGTLALPYIDYIIADRTVIPEEHRIHYSERVVYLPDTYWPTDRDYAMPKSAPTRSEVGLPPTGFVFACHNNTFKIGPDTFDIWMRLLRAIDGSVLWLLEDNPRAAASLRRQAALRGVGPERIVFAPRRSHEEYLARLPLADLLVDTLPYNAHTTACDALWMGLPVVTCCGEPFPARVAASLLKAIGLPELITEDLAEYEALALALARDPARLAAIKSKLWRNRGTEPLFDTARFTRHLEAAYRAMWERQQAGLPPASFAVGAMDAT
jgi:predicted O-linked N-acetylglucosamine transferase (SPINDLY family)